MTAVDQRVFVVVCNEPWIEVVVNWLCAARRQGIENVIVLATDDPSFFFFQARNVSSIHLNVPYTTKKKKDWSHHDRIWLARWEIIYIGLRAGFHIGQADGDAPFVGDPRPIFNLGGDMIFSRDIPTLEWILCMGWVYMRSTNSTIDFVSRVVKRMNFGVPGSPKGAHHDDQMAVNFLAFHHLRFRWERGLNPRDPKTQGQILKGGATLISKIKVTLLPNTMIWRLGCDPRKKRGFEIVVHCREVQNRLVTQEVSAGDKAGGLKVMGGWFLAANTGVCMMPAASPSGGE